MTFGIYKYMTGAFVNMSFFKKLSKNGVSLRVVQLCMVILAVVLSAILIFTTFRASSTFNDLSSATDEYIEMHRAASDLMEASDYLTEKAQCYTITGDAGYLNEYFTEAFETNRRENAISKLSEKDHASAALEELQKAMNGSNDLMKREFYAMKLVIEATGCQEYPEQLKGVTLSAQDASLSAEEKMDLARSMAFDKEYFDQKESIRADMQESIAEIEKITRDSQLKATSDLRRELMFERIIIVVQVAGVVLMLWLTAKLGISPILRAVNNIQDDSPIPEIGANEFRYLARTYNKMDAVYKKSIANLNYKVSHDELTQVYNRSGYELMLDSIDLSSTFLIMFDIDNFKSFNDIYGHDIGDRILKKTAETVKNSFRRDDYICRIGGDEFVVFVVHAEAKQQSLIVGKINRINEALAKTDDGLPAVSISAGVEHGSNVMSPDELFKHADLALYATKREGKRGITFYSSLTEDDIQQKA